jgi:DNA-binding transcriptional LysR family regulator
MSTPLSGSQLLYFVRTAEAGQISRAAASLHIAQPALSSAIMRLERNLGVELFNRHPRGVSLTHAGVLLYDKATIVLRAREDAASTAQALARSYGSTIEVGFLGALPQLIAPGVIERFAALRPDAAVTFRELQFPTTATADWIARVDVALCFSPAVQAGIRMHVLREEPRCVLMHVGHPLARKRTLLVEDVLDEMFCGLHPSVDQDWAGFWSLDDHRGGPPSHVTRDEVTGYMGVAAAAAATGCIGVLPMTIAESIVGRTGPLVATPIGDATPASCALAWSASAEGALTAALVKMAIQECAERERGPLAA